MAARLQVLTADADGTPRWHPVTRVSRLYVGGRGYMDHYDVTYQDGTVKTFREERYHVGVESGIVRVSAEPPYAPAIGREAAHELHRRLGGRLRSLGIDAKTFASQELGRAVRSLSHLTRDETERLLDAAPPALVAYLPTHRATAARYAA